MSSSSCHVQGCGITARRETMLIRSVGRNSGQYFTFPRPSVILRAESDIPDGSSRPCRRSYTAANEIHVHNALACMDG